MESFRRKVSSSDGTEQRFEVTEENFYAWNLKKNKLYFENLAGKNCPGMLKTMKYPRKIIEFQRIKISLAM